MLTEDDIQQRYPLHTFVWKNSHSQLKDYLSLHSKVRKLKKKSVFQL